MWHSLSYGYGAKFRVEMCHLSFSLSLLLSHIDSLFLPELPQTPNNYVGRII